MKAGKREEDMAGSRAIIPIHTVVRGRARLKVAGLYCSQFLKLTIESKLNGAAGIINVFASELTGNVLVIFDPAKDLQEIITALEGLIPF